MSRIFLLRLRSLILITSLVELIMFLVTNFVEILMLLVIYLLRIVPKALLLIRLSLFFNDFIHLFWAFTILLHYDLFKLHDFMLFFLEPFDLAFSFLSCSYVSTAFSFNSTNDHSNCETILHQSHRKPYKWY